MDRFSGGVGGSGFGSCLLALWVRGLSTVRCTQLLSPSAAGSYGVSPTLVHQLFFSFNNRMHACYLKKVSNNRK